MYNKYMNKDVIYLCRFLWDPVKAKKNRKKHKVSFETACRIFNDPLLYCLYDVKNSTAEEDRFLCIGSVDSTYLILTVAVTERENLTRIISARKATAEEVKKYEKNAERI